MCIVKTFNARQCRALKPWASPTPAAVGSLTRALRRVPPGHSLSLGAGSGSAEPGRQWEGNPPSPSPGRGEFPHRHGEMFVPTKSGLGAVCSPPSPGRGRGAVRGRVSSRPAGREGPGQGRAGAAAPGQERHLSACRGSAGERICWSKRFMLRVQDACLLTWLWGEKTHHCVSVRKKTL